MRRLNCMIWRQTLTESRNRAEEHPQVVQKMQRLFETVRTEEPGYSFGAQQRVAVSSD